MLIMGDLGVTATYDIVEDLKEGERAAYQGASRVQAAFD